MSHLAKKLFLICLMASLATPAWAQVPLPPSLPAQLAPQWTPVPGVKGVQYAPSQGLDIFRYGQGYYCYNQGLWYQKAAQQGPWVQTSNIPQAFYQIQAPYFKRPPGWAKGKKAGWGDPSMPPGQMKKQGGGARIPPGQLKKMGQ